MKVYVYPLSSLLIILATLLLCTSCYMIRKSSGAGQTTFQPPRRINPNDIALPQGYSIQQVAGGLIFPTGVTFDSNGRPYVVESGYSYGEVWTQPRLLRIEEGGTLTPIAAGQKNGPWTGVTFDNGNFYVAEGGELQGGRILRVAADGSITVLVSNCSVSEMNVTPSSSNSCSVFARCRFERPKRSSFVTTTA